MVGPSPLLEEVELLSYTCYSPLTAGWQKKSSVPQMDMFQPKLMQKLMCSYKVCAYLQQGTMSLLFC